MGKTDTFDSVMNIVRILRSENGCPWDQVQTHESLERCMIEEAYEAVEGIHVLRDTGDSDNLCEELGDVVFQVAFHSILAEEEGLFTAEDVFAGICRKMIHRHPHVFGHGQAEAQGKTLPDWEQLKKEEKKEKGDARSEAEAVPRAFPALIRAEKVQKKLQKSGLCREDSLEEICEHAKHQMELLETGDVSDKKKTSAAVGKLLYDICRISAKYDIYPEEALTDTIEELVMRVQE